MAIGAARSEIRKHGDNPKDYGAGHALAVLDDIARAEPDLCASLWYLEASDNQIALFRREWKRAQEQRVD